VTHLTEELVLPRPVIPWSDVNTGLESMCTGEFEADDTHVIKLWPNPPVRLSRRPALIL